MPNIIKIFSGNANPELAKQICKHLDMPLSKVEVRRFSDGEIFVEVGENVRGTDVFVIQPTCTPVNDHLMELVIMVDALRRASARRITAVLPYYGYARQDRKVAPRVPITAKVVAEMLTVVGVRRVLAMEVRSRDFSISRSIISMRLRFCLSIFKVLSKTWLWFHLTPAALKEPVLLRNV